MGVGTGSGRRRGRRSRGWCVKCLIKSFIYIYIKIYIKDIYIYIMIKKIIITHLIFSTRRLFPQFE